MTGDLSSDGARAAAHARRAAWELPVGVAARVARPAGRDGTDAM